MSEEVAMKKDDIIKNVRASAIEDLCKDIDDKFEEKIEQLKNETEIAFKIAGAMALQEAIKRAKPILLEPIMKVEIIVPDSFMGEATGDISSRRGQIMSINDRSPMNLKVIDARVPLSEMFGYATSVRSLTEGRGTFNMEFDHYEPVPNNIAELIKEGKK